MQGAFTPCTYICVCHWSISDFKDTMIRSGYGNISSTSEETMKNMGKLITGWITLWLIYPYYSWFLYYHHGLLYDCPIAFVGILRKLIKNQSMDLPDMHNCRLYMSRESFPHHQLQRKLLVSDPGMHQGMCITLVPWCMSGSPTRDSRENVPGIHGTCATRNFAYLVRGP